MYAFMYVVGAGRGDVWRGQAPRRPREGVITLHPARDLSVSLLSVCSWFLGGRGLVFFFGVPRAGAGLAQWGC